MPKMLPDELPENTLLTGRRAINSRNRDMQVSWPFLKTRFFRGNLDRSQQHSTCSKYAKLKQLRPCKMINNLRSVLRVNNQMCVV